VYRPRATIGFVPRAGAPRQRRLASRRRLGSFRHGAIGGARGRHAIPVRASAHDAPRPPVTATGTARYAADQMSGQDRASRRPRQSVLRDLLDDHTNPRALPRRRRQESSMTVFGKERPRSGEPTNDLDILNTGRRGWGQQASLCCPQASNVLHIRTAPGRINRIGRDRTRMPAGAIWSARHQ